jgi:serine/threonine protein kinase
MTWKIFKVFKRKSSKCVKRKEAYKPPNIGTTSSVLPSGGISPIPHVQEPSTMPAPICPLNGPVEPLKAIQTRYIGGAFDSSDMERIASNAESNADVEIENILSIKREIGGGDDDISINLQSTPGHMNEATDERPLLFNTGSDDPLPLTLKPPAHMERALTTCDDGGHVFEADFLRTHPELIIGRDYSKRVPVLKSVRDDLNAGGTKLRSATEVQHTYFIPCTTLHQIMTEQTVRLLLRECDTTLATNVIHQQAAKIAPPLQFNLSPFRRVFAILILIRKPLVIFSFLKNGINDSLLPFELDEDDGPPHAIFTEDDWGDQDIRDFCRTQWEVWPVFFSGQGEKIVHYECRRGEILPFTIAEQEWKLFKKGGNGEITSYQLHPHQQSLTRYTKRGPNRAVAIKKLFKRESREEFDREHFMLDRLTKQVPMPHLAKLLATYEMHKDSHNSGLKDYFLIFECADSTLAELWRQNPEKLMDHPELAKWVACQCQGLADALASIHNFGQYRAQDDLNDRTHGYHGDLRPENVLRYIEWNKAEHKMGILQITDFGLSSFHHTVTVDAISIRNRSGDYRPPESELLTTVSPSLDTWTLGCLSLEFLTWLVQGPQGPQAFKNDRLCVGLVFDRHVCFWEVTENDGVVTVALSRAVINWVTKLCEDKNSSQFVRDFCELIINHMLVIEDKDQASSRHISNGTVEVEPKIPPDKRIETSKLAENMKRFLGKNISYYTPSKPRGPLKLFGQRNCLKVLKPKHQLLKDVVEKLKE